MSKTIGIFKGKQAEHNKQILQTLYGYGPLTAWQITGKLTKHGKVSLHATLNKRLRDLEKKGYVRKVGKQWILNFKGFIANLIFQPNPKPWSDEWNKVLENTSKRAIEMRKMLSQKEQKKLNTMVKENFGLDCGAVECYLSEGAKTMHDFGQLIHLSGEAKKLMKAGVINLDVIKNSTLATLLISEQISLVDDILESSKRDKV